MIKDILKGILSALVAACFFMIFIEVARGSASELPLRDLFFIGLFGTLYSCWLVVPLGAVLGVSIPQLFKKSSATVALLGGSLLGFIFGLAAGLLLGVFFFRTTTQTLSFAVPMSGYVAIWTGLYALLRRRPSKLS